MQVTVPPDLGALVQKRLATGAFASAEDVIRRALEAEESWSDTERRALDEKIGRALAQVAKKDPVLFAKAVMENIIGEKWDTSDPEHSPAKNPHAQALSALGASKGGKARAENLTATQRSKIAKKAAKARWKKRPKAA